MNARISRWINYSVIALLALGCACLAGAGAEDEVTIKTPRKATLQFTNGRMVRGTLLSVDDKEVRLQLDREGMGPIKYKINVIKAIQTADGIWAFNKDTKRFEMKAAQGGKNPPPDKSGKHPAGAGTLIQEEGIVAEGVGADAEEALRDAFRTAIRQVVGTLVDSETLVKDEKVISDKVLTYNDGVITKYDKISEKSDKGLVRIKIQAVVERRNLVARLREFKVFVKEIEGKDVAAEVMTRQEARANATELLQKEMNELPKVLIADARKSTPAITTRTPSPCASMSSSRWTSKSTRRFCGGWCLCSKKSTSTAAPRSSNASPTKAAPFRNTCVGKVCGCPCWTAFGTDRRRGLSTSNCLPTRKAGICG